MACEDCAVFAVVDGVRKLVSLRSENTQVLGIDPHNWGTVARCSTCGTYWRTLLGPYAPEEIPPDQLQDVLQRLFVDKKV
jgi:hypothetical protein